MATSDPASADVAGRTPLVGFYVLYFAAVGVLLPFLPPYLKSLGLSATEVGVLLAMNPLMALWAPTVWAHLADRSGRPDRILTVLAVGAFAFFAPVAVLDAFPWLLLTYCGYAFFSSAITTVADALTLGRVASVGGSYAHIRLFGSAGFVVSSLAFGMLVDDLGRAVVVVALALIGAFALWSLGVRARTTPAQLVNPMQGLRLLGDRSVALLLLSTALHWLACAPFHGTFGIHVTALGLPPWVVGASAGLGVVFEVAVMAAYPRFARRLSPRRVLAVAFAATAVRWAGMAVVDSAAGIVALSALHGLTFGAFYVAAVGFMADRVPAHLRASGQALFVAATFGLGGLLGYLLSGLGYDLLGGARLFAVAAAIEVVAALVVLGVRPASNMSAA